MSDFDPLLLDIPSELHGQRVIVRFLRDDDAEALFAAIDASRERLAPWMPWARHHVSVDDSLRYIRRSQADWILRTRLPVAIVAAETGALVGASGLERINWEVRSFETGYWLRADAEGHGYAQESVRLLTRLSFEVLGANRVEIRMDPRNLRSERVAQRAGYILEGTLRNASVDSTGAPADRHVYALTPAVYAKLPWAGATWSTPPRY